MNPKKIGRPKADPDRDLRRDLLETSRKLLDDGGPSALSMREVARRAGCTHQAPYHYFQDRESILASLVAEGFDELAVRLCAAHDLAETHSVRAALIASSHAYINFALSQPGVFRIMFRLDVCDPSRFPAVQASGRRARGELSRLNAIIYGKKAQAASATILWSHVHGLACLLVDGPLAMEFANPAQRTIHLRKVSEKFADVILSASR